MASIFSRYDLSAERTSRQTRRVSDDQALQNVSDRIVAGDDAEVAAAVERILETHDPSVVISEGLVAGMREVSRLWAEGVFFLPQVIVASDAMMAGIAQCEAKMGRSMVRKAKVVTHTAEGDIHDIGQVIVNALLNAAGFEVINLGADVPADTVVEACALHRPVMVTGTALMTTTMTAFPRISARLRRLDLSIPFVCGGGAVSEQFVGSFELGIWGKDASQAPAMAEDALNGLDWSEMRRKWNG